MIRQRKMIVSVPAGVETGTQIRLKNEGDVGNIGGPMGDLYVSIKVNPHKLFQRNGNDVLFDVKVNFSQAALGASVQVSTIDGEIMIEIPQGAQSGDIVRLKHKGIPKLGGGTQRGDQIIRLIVETPRSLSDQQRDLIEKLGETFAAGTDSEEMDKNWIGKVKDSLAGSE